MMPLKEVELSEFRECCVVRGHVYPSLVAWHRNHPVFAELFPRPSSRLHPPCLDSETTPHLPVSDTHHGRGQEHWNHWHGGYGEDVCEPIECCWLEVGLALLVCPRFCAISLVSPFISAAFSCYDDRECIWLEYGGKFALLPSW